MGNGFDINNFGSMISNLGKATAGLHKDKNTIDTKGELNTYVSGWDAIKESAEKQGATTADIASLEGDMKTGYDYKMSTTHISLLQIGMH